MCEGMRNQGDMREKTFSPSCTHAHAHEGRERKGREEKEKREEGRAGGATNVQQKEARGRAGIERGFEKE